MVFFAHCYALLGHPALSIDYGGVELGLGGIAVCIFFAVSGFLVTQSWYNTGNTRYFIKKRVMRIYPGLALNFIVTVFIIGALCTALDPASYYREVLTHIHTHFLTWAVFYPIPLPEVFAENPKQFSVNGSLWTLFYEVLCYTALVIGCACFRSKRTLPIMTLLYFAFYWNKISFPQTDADWPWVFCAVFLCAASLAVYNAYIVYRGYVALTLLALLVVFYSFGVYSMAAITLMLAYLTIYLGLRFVRLAKFGKYGDFSYGIYIYAFPVQQAFVSTGWFSYNDATFPLFVLCSFLTILFLAAVSWHLVEKRALQHARRTPSNN